MRIKHSAIHKMLGQNIGSVSSATMRQKDLIPAFVACLESQKPLRREHRKLITEINKDIEQTDEDEDYFESENADYALDALFNALNEYALPYFYFGSHPGDGADYGFWLSEGWEDDFEGIIESSNGFLARYTQNRREIDEIPRGYTGELAEINDHGNVTLYYVVRGRKYEVWALV
jgi:hypothetical protein